jgi:apolipoprotein N-acyltransferase
MHAKRVQLLKISKADLAAACAGFLTALAFVWPYSIWAAALGWMSLVPLVLVLHTCPWRRGFIAGICFFAPVLYWLNYVMVDFGALHPSLSLGLYLLLCAYLAMFWGAACWCSNRIIYRVGMPLCLVFPLTWITCEFLRGKLLTGFPWGNIAYSQASLPLLVQSVDLGGIWVPMFVLLLINCAIAMLWRVWRQRTPGAGVSSAELWLSVGAAGCLFVANAAYGYQAYAHFTRNDSHSEEYNATLSSEHSGKTLKVALIQANIDQHQKWLRDQRLRTLNLYTEMSRTQADADLIVWPESATPFYYAKGSPYADRVDAVARDLGVYLLFGSPAREDSERGYSYLNSAYLLNARAQPVARTDKVHLVPFGEYVPLNSVLGFVDKMAAGVGDFRPGTLKLLPLGGRGIGVLICYEAIFPRLARTQVEMGAQLLFNLTNDAWFGDTPAPHQHLQMARFRAMENRRWLARCANTGVSALIDPLGRMHAPTQVFKAGVVSGEVEFREDLTLYTRCGDVLAWIALALVAGWLWQGRKKRL